jgi:hypothetical protein
LLMAGHHRKTGQHVLLVRAANGVLPALSLVEGSKRSASKGTIRADGLPRLYRQVL